MIAEPKPLEPDNRDFYLEKPKPGGFTIGRVPRFDRGTCDIEMIKHIKRSPRPNDNLSGNLN